MSDTIRSSRVITLRPEYPIGEPVFLRSRGERLEGRVTGFLVRPTDLVYIVAWGDATESNHYDFELAEEPEF